MKPEFNYESVPFDFSHCFCGQCKVADKCLRHQVALRIPESRYSVPVINPNNVSPDGENCRYSSITESIPNRFMMNIRKSIVGKS